MVPGRACARVGRRSGGAGAVERGVRPVRDRPPRRRLAGADVVDPTEADNRPPRPARGGGLSKSATKTRIEPERVKKNVDIPRFSSRPIPARSAFVADLDTTPPQESHQHHSNTPRITFHSFPRTRRFLVERVPPIYAFD